MKFARSVTAAWLRRWIRAILREVKHGAEIVLGETNLERDKPARLFVALHSTKWDREQIYTFDVMQVSGGRIVRPLHRPACRSRAETDAPHVRGSRKVFTRPQQPCALSRNARP